MAVGGATRWWSPNLVWLMAVGLRSRLARWLFCCLLAAVVSVATSARADGTPEPIAVETDADDQADGRTKRVDNASPVVSASISDLSTRTGVPFEYNLRPAGTVMFGFDRGGTDIQITDNYFASTVRFKEFADVTYSGNTVVSQDPIKAMLLDDTPSAATLNRYDWGNNRYTTNTQLPFVYGSSKTWQQWRSETGLDDVSTLSTIPSGTVIRVRPNQYEPGRGHVVVYNWDRLEFVEIDLSEVVHQGSLFQIYNVLDLDGKPVVSDVYSGGLVTLPMVDVISPCPIGHQSRAPVTVDREFGAFLIVSESAPIPPTGHEYYVSTSGTASGDGSLARPWDLATAMAHPSVVVPGDTIWILGGTYSGRVTSHLSGTAAAPISVRAFPGDDVKLDLNRGQRALAKLMTIAGQYTHYQGFEIFSSDPSSRTTVHAGSWPADIDRGNINVFGDHVKLINLRIHDLNKGLGFWSRADGGEVYGSLIYCNGWSGPDREHGHGIYSQNEGFTRLFADNIVFNQFRNGIKIYGSDAASLKNFRLRGNVAFNNGGGKGEGFSGAFQILIGGGTLVENVRVEQNFTYVGKYIFQDFDLGDSITLSTRQTNGEALPEWLSFASDEGYFFGTPAAGDVGSIEIEVIATDSSDAQVAESFTLSVVGPSDGGLPGRL